MKRGWEIKKLGDCFDYIKNGANIKQERGAGGIPITRIETLSGGIFNRDRLGYANIQDINKYESHILESEDLLLSHINSKTYIGRTVVYVKDGDETIIHGMNLLRLRATRSVINPFLFYYYSLSDKFNGQIANRRKDAVNQSSISVGDLKTIVVPIPPLPEQERIVAELDCLSSIIEKQKEQLKELDNLAQSIFYTMFGDPISNNYGWETLKLSEGCDEIGDGLHGTPNYDSNGKIAFINGVNMVDGKIQLTDKTQFVNEVEAKKHSIKMGTNTVLLSINGTLGKTAIYRNEDIILGKSACYCNIKENILDVIFLERLMRTDSFKVFLENNSSKSTIKNVGLKAIRNYRVITPPLTVQQEFASKIEAIEKQKELIKKSIEETETLFNSRMDYYFN